MTARERHRSGRKPLALAAAGSALALSATAFVAAFPPLGVRGLAWCALVPLLALLRTRRRDRDAFAAAALWGMASAYGVTDWLPPTLADYYGQPYLLGLGLFLAASALMGALEYGLFAVLWRRGAARCPALAVPLAAAAFAAAELGRARLFTGNPWGLLGYSQMGFDLDAAGSAALAARVVQVADFGGVFAVGFVLVAVNAALAEVCLALARVRRSRPAPALVMAAAVLFAAWSYGGLRLQEARPPAADAPQVGIVQANIDRGSRWDPSLYGANLGSYLSMSRSLLAEGPVDLLVWPENAVTFFVDAESDYRRAIAVALAPDAPELLVGAPRYEGLRDPSYFNSAFLLAAGGEVLAVYDKQHLLPFAEYFPFGAIEVLQRNFGRVRSFTPGTRIEPLATRAGLAGIAICNEAMFGHIVRARQREGVDLLVNLSNDSWVVDPEFALHQFQLVSMRAVEFRLPLVRASTSGPSAVIDPWGRILARSEVASPATLRARLPSGPGAGLYARWGDAFAVLCLLGALAAALAPVRSGGRRLAR